MVFVDKIRFILWISTKKMEFFRRCLFYRCIHHYNEIEIALEKVNDWIGLSKVSNRSNWVLSTFTSSEFERCIVFVRAGRCLHCDCQTLRHHRAIPMRDDSVDWIVFLFVKLIIRTSNEIVNNSVWLLLLWLFNAAFVYVLNDNCHEFMTDLCSDQINSHFIFRSKLSAEQDTHGLLTHHKKFSSRN